jgi:hypothetical protein
MTIHGIFKDHNYTYDELLARARSFGAKNIVTTAITDLICQAIEKKTYKFIHDIRNENSDIVIQTYDILVLFSFANEATFWVVWNPSWDGNVIQLVRSNNDGTSILETLYEG